MPQVTWPAAPDGRYWIDVRVGGYDLQVMIDTGLVDAKHEVGFELEPAVYAQLLGAGRLVAAAPRIRRDAGGTKVPIRVGSTDAQLLCPVAKQPVGPPVAIHVAEGAVGVPTRVGIEFFHRLTGCRVLWDLDSRLWSMDYP
jgi:hypothetical protein